MCGIAGFFIKNNSISTSESQDLLLTMTRAIKHRGPDEFVSYLDRNCALGMQRLAIVDLHEGLYPIYSTDKSKLLIYNGEIYNFPELRKVLEKKYRFATDSDGEVIVHGYCEWGLKVFEKLRGMFAVALWDKSTETLHLVRDRIGIKPLYYVENEIGVFFSSEAKSLLSSSKISDRKINLENIHLLTGLMYLPKVYETPIKNMKKVAPSSIMSISGKGTHISKYWELNVKGNVKELPFEDAVDQLDNLLVKTVRMHLMSDVPLGLMLSGGVDSALLAGLIIKNGLASQLNTYTAKFDHKFNESDLAKKTADYLGSTHHEIKINTRGVGDKIEDLIDVFDDLSTFDGGAISTKLLCREIRKQKIKVLLLGEGADEIFGGYSWFGLSKLPLKHLPKFLRSYIYYYATSRNLTSKPIYFTKYLNKEFTNDIDVFQQISKYEVTNQLPNHLLMKVDKGSMSESIEARVPYLDHKIVEFVYSLNSAYKLKGDFVNLSQSMEKYILRKVAEKYLPAETALRKKRGFLLPMGDIISANIDKVRFYVLSDSSLCKNICSEKFLNDLFTESTSQIVNMQREYFLWRLFILEVWAKKFDLAL